MRFLRFAERTLLAVLLMVLMVSLAGLAGAATKYASGTASAAVTFGPASGPTTVKSVYATSDKLNGSVKFYARGGAGKEAPTTTHTNGATVIAVGNSDSGFATSDSVVYVHANGTCDYRTLSGATTTNVTLSSGISVAGASGDYLYEVTQQGQIWVGFYGTGVGTNDTVATAGDVFMTPGDSPLYCVLDGTSNAVLQVTTDQ